MTGSVLATLFLSHFQLGKKWNLNLGGFPMDYLFQCVVNSGSKRELSNMKQKKEKDVLIFMVLWW
jgi:hypothetical protein